jgi:hypothetical protein
MIPVRIEDFRRKQREIFNAESFFIYYSPTYSIFKNCRQRDQNSLIAIK